MNGSLNGCRVGLGAAVALALLAGAAPALAQNALGDGTGLYHDLKNYSPAETGGSGSTQSNFMNEVRRRNAEVTGNAPDGRSLMIARPYSAPDDFRGNLATDSLFDFQRDSMGSTQGYSRAGGYQYGQTRQLWKPVSRLGTYGAGSDLPRAGYLIRPQGPLGPRQRNPSDAAAESAATPAPTADTSDQSNIMGTLRSLGSYTTTNDLTPSVVGVQASATGGVSKVTASSLLGVRSSTYTNKYVDQPQTGRDESGKPEPRPNSAAGPDVSAESQNLSASSPAFKTAYDDLRVRLNDQNKPDEAKPSGPEKLLPAGQHPDKELGSPGTQKPDADKLGADKLGADKLGSDKLGADKPGTAKPGADKPNGMPTWDERLQRLRDQMNKDKNKKSLSPNEKTSDQEGVDEKTKDAAGTDGSKSDPTKKDARGKDISKRDRDKKQFAMAGLDNETLEIIRKSGGEAKTYTTGAPGSLFESHLKAGEEALAKGQYFDAEERFTHALAMRPGDATAMAARLHAQMGAGLYLSAATNLRQLFLQHPDVMGMRYTGTTLPAQTRMTSLAQEMRENITKAKKEGTKPPQEAGLLLAYVGFQTNDPAVIREGLAALRESPDGANDSLVPVLEGVWTGSVTK